MVSLALAAGISSIATLIDWRLNPGGIFHNESGTVWPIVWETWSSWFLPTFIVAVFVVLAFASLVRRR